MGQFNNYPVITTLENADTLLAFQQSSGSVKQIQKQNALAGLEPAVPAGNNTQYYRGDKTWQTLNAAAVDGLGTAATKNVGTGSNDVASGDSLSVQVTSIAALRAVGVGSFNTGRQALIAGYYTQADGGGGQFIYDSTSALADDGGTIIAPNSGSGRWLRVFDGAVNVKWFGAKGDGIQDDASYINAAISYLRGKGGGAVYLPAGTYYVTEQVLIDFSNCKIYGDGIGVTTIKVGAWVDGIRVANGYPGTNGIINDIEICHLSINGNRTAFSSPDDTNGNGINLNSVQNFFVHHVHVYDSSQQGIASTFWGVIGTETQSQASVCDCIVDMTLTIPQIAIGFEGHFSRCVAVGNRVTFSTVSGAGIYFGNNGETNKDDRECVCLGNILSGGSTQGGIGVHCEQNWRYITITGNTIRTFDLGIRADNGTGSSTYAATITGNTIDDFWTSGILTVPINGVARDTTISGNTIRSSRNTVQYALNIGSGTVVVGNSILNPSGGIGIISDDGCMIIGNYINSSSNSVQLPVSGTTTIVASNEMSSGVDNQFSGVVTNNWLKGYSYTSGTRLYNSVLAVGGRQITVSNAPPGSGTWVEGDIVINQAAVANGVPGWQCVAGGAPGTWSAMAANGLTRAAHQANSIASDVPTLVSDFNALLSKLQSAGLMA